MNIQTGREILGFLAAVFISLTAVLLLTWPMALHMDEAILGAGELGGWLWRYDWHFRSLDAILSDDIGPLDTWRAFVGLGRYPETGNVLDVLAFSYPLQAWFGLPLGYNLKVFLILTVNGAAAYALGRYFSGSISAALAASVIAVVNPLCLLEVQACGLRQAVLWWVLLYPALLDRALRRRSLGSGMLAGACLALCGAFYWFYGLFAAMFSVIWFIKHLLVERERLDRPGTLRTILGAGLGLMLAVSPFILPYAAPESDPQAAHKTSSNALPELTFFLPFPAYDTIAKAPLRPDTYAENVLASLNRTIGSSWSASYIFDPRLNEGLPLVVLFFGLIPALRRRRAWGWLAVWFIFYLGTLGPFLRIGQGDNYSVLRVMDDYVVRMPYTWMFHFIPGMARMFAPYRLAAFVIVASTALVAIGVARLRWRSLIAPLVIAATVVQPMLRLGRGAINEMDTDLKEFRSPFKMNRMEIPEFYRSLDPAAYTGIIELPLEQQQDILCYYQTVHQQKVYRSWASPGSLPPSLRSPGSGGEAGKHMRYQARPDLVDGSIPALWQDLSTRANDADVSLLSTPELQTWTEDGRYQWVVLHERGYLLVDSTRGFFLYQSARDLLTRVWGPPVETLEAARADPANVPFGLPITGELIPWSSQPLKLPREGMPDSYRMAVFKMPVEFMEYGETP